MKYLLLIGVLVFGGMSGAHADILDIFKPELPVTVTYRPSALGKGYVINLHNTSNKFLTVIVTIHNPTLQTGKAGHEDLRPFHGLEIGWAQGWEFTSGDLIEVRNADYRPLDVKLP